MLRPDRRKRRRKVDVIADSGRPLRPTGGKITIFGEDEPHDVRERIGYMSHAPMLYDEFTGQENLRYFASLYPGRECLEPAEALRQVGLDPNLERPLGQYSQGMRQRTSLARVLMPVPELLLLDEPFSNMDIESTRQNGRAAGRIPAQEPDHRDHHAPAGSCGPHRRLDSAAEGGDASRSSRPGVRRYEDQRARFLESLGIPFELREYEVDPRICRRLGWPKRSACRRSRCSRTLLTSGGPGVHVFAVIPGDAELDFKKLARAAGLRKAEMVSLKDVQPLTGYIRGGVTVFGAKKAFPVYVDETAILFDAISVSAGTRGTQLILKPDDYLRAAQALDVPVATADLTKTRQGSLRRSTPHDLRVLDTSREGPAHRVAIS